MQEVKQYFFCDSSAE